MKIKENILLAKYTTFKIGGGAKYFLVAKTKEDLIEGVKFARQKHLPFFVLGGGSNLLVSDEGFEGLIIKLHSLDQPKIHISPLLRSSGLISLKVEAGIQLKKVVEFCVKNGLTGLEWAAGIPGTVGGAIYGNAAAFGKSMADIVEKIEVFDASESRIKNYGVIECKFGYKESIFKKNKNLIILSCIISLKKGNKKEIKEKIKYFLDYRERHHPLNLPSAGSVFKNPPGISAGELIEKCGLKGKRIGDAQVSQKHANFIVNLGKARAEDILKLINLIKEEVKKKFGIVLEEEIQYLGF